MNEIPHNIALFQVQVNHCIDLTKGKYNPMSCYKEMLLCLLFHSE
jgi:hypothetical protein